MKISFDFDSTLEYKHIQDYAKELMDKGYEIHIVTSRPKKWSQKWKVRGNPYILWDNDDLYEVADRLGIIRENIHFTDYTPKYKFFDKDKDFIFHLDDDYNETFGINNYTKIKGITLDSDEWREKCDEALFINFFTNVKNANIPTVR